MPLNLLQPVRSAGYPRDYLRARVMGRRHRFITDWDDSLQGAPAAADAGENRWRDLLAELHWLRTQMTEADRRLFEPVFCHFELRTLLLCLRLYKARTRQRIETLLAASQLSDKIKGLLLQERDLAETLLELSRHLGDEAGGSQRLRQAAGQGDLQPFEAVLIKTFWEAQNIRQLPSALQGFLRHLIDGCNLLALGKEIRWSIRDGSEPIKGGSISPRQLARLRRGEDIRHWSARVPREKDWSSRLERRLLTEIRNELRRASRRSEPVAVLLDHIWRLYLQTRNLGLIAEGRSLAREVVDAELTR